MDVFFLPVEPHIPQHFIEFDFVTQVPIHVLEFMAVFFNVLENIFYMSMIACFIIVVNCFNYFK